jgi:hypothetical protein
VALLEAVPKLDEVTVTASRYDLINDVQPSASYFSRDDIENLADLGDDTLRAAHRLPGIAASEFSARSHVRGGATDEMTVMLDGMELIEPFHLRDYASVFSAIDQRIVSGLQIYSGGFPAAYGDALSGLMLIEPREPTELAHEIGVSLLHTAVLSSGTFADGRGSWLASARRSNLGEVIHNERGEPTYHDVFARVGMDVGAKHRLTVNSMGFETTSDDPASRPSTSERAAASDSVSSGSLTATGRRVIEPVAVLEQFRFLREVVVGRLGVGTARVDLRHASSKIALQPPIGSCSPGGSKPRTSMRSTSTRALSSASVCWRRSAERRRLRVP